MCLISALLALILLYCCLLAVMSCLSMDLDDLLLPSDDDEPADTDRGD